MASLLRCVPLALVLTSLLNLDWHPALELVLPLAIKDNEPLQSAQPQLSRKGTRRVSSHAADVSAAMPEAIAVIGNT